MDTQKTLLVLVFLFTGISVMAQPKEGESLVPPKPSAAPDYFCTWNVQGYVDNYNSIRGNMTEAYMFGTGKWQNWLSFYPKVRYDLFFVMDDSWDIPMKDKINKDTDTDIGTIEVSTERFPSFTGTPGERLRHLVDSVKSYGWKGLGGWICAQKASGVSMNDTDFWRERLETAEKAGFAYWKVDWGHQSRDDNFRRNLSRWGHQYAPNMYIEAAMKTDYIKFADVYRTYDVENIIAQPVTIQRIAELLPLKKEGDAKGIINCEDEPEIAVGLGCAIGVMRHPFVGNWPNGQTDYAFPAVGRCYKLRLDEVTRGVRWHRIAEPFGVDNDCEIDEVKLDDYWTYHEHESWQSHKDGEKIKASAPARISRCMPLPVTNDTTSHRPYLLASKYPNGSVVVVAIGRTIDRSYILHKVDVLIEAESWLKPLGIFGYYKSLTINFRNSLKSPYHTRVWAQDLAGETPVEITDKVVITQNSMTIPGDVIQQVGLMAKTKGDLSDPGLVVQVYGEEADGTDSVNIPSARSGNHAAWYNLQGVSVSTGGRSSLPKGIYLHNGNKVLIR